MSHDSFGMILDCARIHTHSHVSCAEQLCVICTCKTVHKVLILLQKYQRSRQVSGRVQSDSGQVMSLGPELSSLILLHAGPPFLPRRE